MSRLEFRAAVATPRPAAAWMMVGVAGATLWITRQLDVWAVGLQVVLLLASFVLRFRPHPWQQSPAALNVGMLCIVGATIVVALRGEPSTIALAHFAALTQGLQLLDARPRRTEFLLVALALFQVILAANLTDSILFFPLLAAFVVSTTWTLLVHTLRTEAEEAGMASAVTTAITPGLARTTLFASALSLALALLFFLALPRMRAGMVQGPSLGFSGAAAGFSDRVELGDLGRIRQDATVVMRVETLAGEAPLPRQAYWRGIAFDSFDGRAWSVTPPGKHLVAGSAEVGISLAHGGVRGEFVQQIVREPVQGGVLFSAGTPDHLRGDLRRVHRDVNGALYAPGLAENRIRYRVSSRRNTPTEEQLARDRARPEDPGDRRFLELPELSSEVGALAREITADATDDAGRARALESWLRSHGRYDDRPPRLPEGDSRSPIEVFLFGGVTGHCEYFASSMVVLARSLGMPARLVNGFAGGRENKIGGFVELTRSDAHAWLEIQYETAGWVAYDPTPPDLRLRASGGLSFLDRVSEVGSAMELWWFQRVVDFDRSDQFHAMRSAWVAWRGARQWSVREQERASERLVDWQFDPELLKRALIVAPIGVAAAAVLSRLLRRRRRAAAPPRAYEKALRLLARQGLERATHETARGFVREVHAARPGEAACVFEELTESYLMERFGGRRDERALTRVRELRRLLGVRASPAVTRRSHTGAEGG
jgi:transglutaminase-like putative cysteine protease